jgi:hypothetical protein
MVKPKPDISCAKKTGHFDLLTTVRCLAGEAWHGHCGEHSFSEVLDSVQVNNIALEINQQVFPVFSIPIDKPIFRPAILNDAVQY